MIGFLGFFLCVIAFSGIIVGMHFANRADAHDYDTQRTWAGVLPPATPGGE